MISGNDLPPSYEQAMESAPRYSTLFLDAGSEIHEQLLESRTIDPQPTIIAMNSGHREVNPAFTPHNYVQKLVVVGLEKSDVT
ncbi:hypothetical protein LSTR_LSTR015047 [Laodelphax striatellus]|uniref:Uncharacterized protein n=1 Tax=Laodelphax striatellus TaxID=195883 RepID=A0A482X687_LAOST|nr:hypothetical protein LSTR_LSTR015047 [Laodelphax striatellus]